MKFWSQKPVQERIEDRLRQTLDAAKIERVLCRERKEELDSHLKFLDERIERISKDLAQNHSVARIKQL